MPLRGTVTDYGLADVLQLVAGGTRSGRLELERGAERLELIIDAGAIVEVRSDFPSEAALGARLVQAGLLGQERLGAVLAERARSGQGIAEILHRANDLAIEELRQHSSLQRWDTVLAPFTWTDGHYAFVEAEVVPPDSWAEPIPVEQLLIRGLRLVEEWPTAIARIPSRSWVIARRLPLPAPSTDSDPFGAAFNDGGEPDPLGEEARWLHALATPEAQVAGIIARAPFDRYACMLVLSELVERGFLVVSPP